MKNSQKKTKPSIILFLGVVLAFIFTACGKKDPLEGVWKRIDYQINQDEQEIEYTESEISFADGRMEKENKILLYELADDEHAVYLSDGSTESKMEFNIEDNSLFFDGDLYYKADSEEYKQYYAEMEKQAQTELDALIAQVEEEEALKKAKEEALITASQLWDDSVNEMISDFDTAVSDTQERLKKEVISMLEGTWIYNRRVGTDIYIFANGTVTLNQDWRFTQKTAEGIVEVVLTPYLEFSQFDDKQLLNDTLEADLKLDILQENCPFNEEWELQDLQNAESYITEHFEPLHSQIDDIKNLTLENLKDSKNILSAIFDNNGLKFGTVDVSTITSEKMIMIANSHEYELYKQ